MRSAPLPVLALVVVAAAAAASAGCAGCGRRGAPCDVLPEDAGAGRGELAGRVWDLMDATGTPGVAVIVAVDGVARPPLLLGRDREDVDGCRGIDEDTFFRLRGGTPLLVALAGLRAAEIDPSFRVDDDRVVRALAPDLVRAVAAGADEGQRAPTWAELVIGASGIPGGFWDIDFPCDDVAGGARHMEPQVLGLPHFRSWFAPGSLVMTSEPSVTEAAAVLARYHAGDDRGDTAYDFADALAALLFRPLSLDATFDEELPNEARGSGPVPGYAFDQSGRSADCAAMAPVYGAALTVRDLARLAEVMTARDDDDGGAAPFLAAAARRRLVDEPWVLAPVPLEDGGAFASSPFFSFGISGAYAALAEGGGAPRVFAVVVANRGDFPAERVAVLALEAAAGPDALRASSRAAPPLADYVGVYTSTDDAHGDRTIEVVVDGDALRARYDGTGVTGTLSPAHPLATLPPDENPFLDANVADAFVLDLWPLPQGTLQFARDADGAVFALFEPGGGDGPPAFKERR